MAASALSGLAGRGRDPLGVREAVNDWTHGRRGAPVTERHILVYGDPALAQPLHADGYAVTGVARDAALPADLRPYSQIWRVDALAPAPGDVTRLVGYARSGHGLLLTGTGRPDGLDATDTAIVNSLVNRPVTLVPRDRPDAAPRPVNLAVLAGRPCARPTWYGTWGAITGAAGAGTVATNRDGTAGAAVWPAAEVHGGGRIALLMSPLDGHPLSGCLARDLAAYLAGRPGAGGH